MQRVLAFPRGTADYLHPDEEVQIVDEASGVTYSVLIKGTAERLGETGSVVVHVPVQSVASVALLNGYLVLELRQLGNEADLLRQVEGVQRGLPSRK